MPVGVIGYFLALGIGLSLGLIGGGGSILAVPTLVYIKGYRICADSQTRFWKQLLVSPAYTQRAFAVAQ